MKHFDDVARYGVNAMELLINRMLSLGAKRSRMVAKAFGGGHIIPAISEENGIGRQNVAFALDFLEKEGTQLISQDLGGKDSRKVSFHTDTGDVFLKRIPSVHLECIAKEENKRLGIIRREVRKPGDVLLFESQIAPNE